LARADLEDGLAPGLTQKDTLEFQIHRILAKLNTSTSRSCRKYEAILRELPSKPSLVAGEGFEPSKAEPGDLQAAR